MKNKYYNFTCVCVSMILIICFFITACGHRKKADSASIFSWEKKVVFLEDSKKLSEVIEKLKIKRLFQTFDDTVFNTEDIHTFLKFLNDSDVEAYYLTGDPSWAGEKGFENMKSKIDIVYTWNEKAHVTEYIQGIVFDVEPYLSDDWEENSTEILKGYIENAKKAYEYASSKNILTVICIPYWYDKDHGKLLEELIEKCCDEVAVMNYYKFKEFEFIKTEVSLAQKYNKSISNIFEFTMAGKHGLSEKNTYHTEGVQAAQTVFEKLYSDFNYSKLYLSYHCLKPISEILE